MNYETYQLAKLRRKIIGICMLVIIGGIIARILEYV